MGRESGQQQGRWWAWSSVRYRWVMNSLSSSVGRGGASTWLTMESAWGPRMGAAQMGASTAPRCNGGDTKGCSEDPCVMTK